MHALDKQASHMDDTTATLLLTRPKAQSEAFLSACEAQIGHRLPVVIAPLLRIEPVGEVPDLDAFETLVLTSGNGVARLGSALANRQVVTVGDKTAELARGFGAIASALGENVDAFLENAPKFEGRVLFCRGVHSRGELAQKLSDLGNTVEEAVLYDQIGQPLGEAGQRLLTGRAMVVAPLFSPRTAKLLSANQITAPLKVLAISQATADAWAGPGELRIAERPDADHMRQMVQEAF